MNRDDLSALAPAPATSIQQTTMRILLVDDEPRMLSSLEALLLGRGQLVSASCGLEALAQLRQNTFDLAILDLNLPDIDGHEIMDFMNAQNTGASIIVTSGASGIDAAIGALKRGAYDYLRKPYAREELLKTVDNALQQRRLQAENQRIAAQLEHSERVHRNLVDSSPDIIYTLDAQGRFTFVNDRAQQVLGLDREALIGQHYAAFFHEEDLERAHYVFSEVQQQRHLLRNVELRLKTGRPGGEARTFSHALLGTDPHAHGQSGVYGVARDITERKQAEELITYQTYHDILTQLPNRVLFKDRLGLALLQAKRHDTGLAVMFIDLDRFKLINDTLGHGTGDLLLQQVTARLQTCLRRCDTLSRLGGDEFTVVLPELTDRQNASAIAEKFSEALRQPFELAGQTVHVSASIGIAVYPQDGQTVDELIRNADSAMYHRKTQGKNGHAFFDHAMLDAAAHKIAIEHSLHLALERGELEMYYQPQVDVKTKKIIGAEALIRWNHPERGFLGAGEFLPFAEENGLMIPITDWMLETICLDLHAWNAVSSEPLRLSINLSPQYLDRGDFFDKFKDALQRHRVPPAQIEVEVTENISIRNPQAAIDQLDKLCQLGVSVAIDDFGTGYSSLSYLHRFPIHTLKIDRAFITDIQDEHGQFPVVRAIISIAQGLGLNLVAEGVETLAQERYLEQTGCRIMQGYLYHKPMSQTRLLELLRVQAPAASSVLAPGNA